MNSWLYNQLMHLAGPVVSMTLERRARRGKEEPARLDERRGIPSLARPEGRLAWLHAASVGEATSAMPLVHALLRRFPDLHILVTTGTVSSARLLEARLPPRAFHQFVPVDRPGYVSRFLDHWRPDMALWMESELWPGLLGALRARKVPAALVNARLSEKSLKRWQRMKSVAREMVGGFEICLCQNVTVAAGLEALGARRAVTVGNLKFAAARLPRDEDALAALRDACGARPVWMMASTHPGEDQVAIYAHRRLAERIPGLLTIITPRHAARGEEVAHLAGRHYLSATRRSTGALPDKDTGIYIADTLGEMGTLYSAVPVACIGGSFVEKGGHNPIEAAWAGCAVLAGPHMENAEAICAIFEDEDALLRCRDGAELGQCLVELLLQPETARHMGKKAQAIARREAHVVDAVMRELEPVTLIAGLDQT